MKIVTNLPHRAGKPVQFQSGDEQLIVVFDENCTAEIKDSEYKKFFSEDDSVNEFTPQSQIEQVIKNNGGTPEEKEAKEKKIKELLAMRKDVLIETLVNDFGKTKAEIEKLTKEQLCNLIVNGEVDATDADEEALTQLMEMSEDALKDSLINSGKTEDELEGLSKEELARLVLTAGEDQ